MAKDRQATRTSPSLTLVATPIGNLADLSPRATESMRNADFWIVEDTRVSGKLAQFLGTKKPMTVLNDHTSEGQLQRIVSRLLDGESAALMSDAGTPGVSDPGAALVDVAYQAGLVVDAIPGPSAVSTALSLSGFFAQRYAFLGYLPRKRGDIRREVQPYVASTFTIVLFESPHRVRSVLEVIYEVLGKRRIAICRELTKLHQQVWRGDLDQLPNASELPTRGEFTIVIEGLRKSVVKSSHSTRLKGSQGGDEDA